MKNPENNKWLDELLSETITNEQLKPDFENWCQSHPEAVQILKSRGHRMGTSPVTGPHDLWRTLMKTRIAKLTAAAAIILIAALAITFFEKSTPTAYAIEQTIEAIKDVSYIHTIRRNEAGQLEDERWIEIDCDGYQARYRQDTPQADFLVVDDRQTVFVYRKDKNAVVLYGADDKCYTWVSNLGQFFRDMAGESAVTIEENVSYKGQPAHRVRWLKLNVDCYIDPETKLPMTLGPDEIYYERPPEGTFEIPAIPEGVTLVDKRPGAEQVEEPDWLKGEEIAQQKFNEARHALATGEYDQAVELFKEVVEIQARRNWAWFWLGRAYYELDEYDAAIHAYTQVIKMFGKMVPYYCHLARGIAYRKAGMQNMAQEDFNIALPVMIDTLRNTKGAHMFDHADDPGDRGRGLPTEQTLTRMVDRLREATGQDFGYNPDANAEENEQAITAWENWWSEHTANNIESP